MLQKPWRFAPTGLLLGTTGKVTLCSAVWHDKEGCFLTVVPCAMAHFETGSGWRGCINHQKKHPLAKNH
eukprot:scaffold11978_cov17-Tisochrysis_lutea.AAC.1